ncbi:MAG: host attachment protein [Gammaproteobacteria bacterium]
MSSIWILAADASRARFFSAESSSSPLEEIEDLAHPEARLHDRDITQDLPGKHKNFGGIAGHSYEQATDPKKYEAEIFARRIVQYLEEAHNADRFGRLIIIADPSMLGLLRKELPEQIKKQISFELDKNIASFDAADIRSHLPNFLP